MNSKYAGGMEAILTVSIVWAVPIASNVVDAPYGSAETIARFIPKIFLDAF